MFALGKTNFDKVMFINITQGKKFFTSVISLSIKLLFMEAEGCAEKGEANKKLW